MSKEEIDSVIDKALFENSSVTDDCYRKIAEILFEDRNSEQQQVEGSQPKDIFQKLSEE